MDLDVLSTPGHLISLAARGFARLSEARLKPLGFGVGHLPVLVALRDGKQIRNATSPALPGSRTADGPECSLVWSGSGSSGVLLTWPMGAAVALH